MSKKTLLTAWLLLALPLAAPAQPESGQPESGQPESGLSLEVERFTLPNGLRVFVHRDPSAPLISTNIWYHVGSAHERPDRTGFAHLFEHIMFEGSANVPRGKIDEWFEEVGGSPNGTTSRDRTNYMQTFARHALDMALFIESDRLGLLLPAMGPRVVDGQREVVKNERRQRMDNQPYGIASQLLSELLYPPEHPYHWPVIGYMDHLEAASYDDVVEFFERYYAPNNATLAIVGDVDVDEARELTMKWFGEFPAGEPLGRLEAPEPRLGGEERVAYEDRVQLPRLYMSWLTPPAFEAGDVELDVLGQVLASGRNSRLYRRMVYELQIADSVSAGQASGRLSSDFRIIATARSGHTLAELEAVILEELERLGTEPPTEREVERVLNQYESGFFEGMERMASKADALNAYYFHTGEPNGFEADLARYRGVEPEHVSAAAARYLDPERRVVLSIVPRGRLDLAAADSRVLPQLDYSLSPEGRMATTAAARSTPEATEADAGDLVSGTEVNDASD